MERDAPMAWQRGRFGVNVEPFLRHRTGPAPSRLPSLSREFLCRAGLVAVFATLAHQIAWEWLRFLTSEAILRISASLGMATARVSFDTIRVGNELFQFVTA